MSMEKYGFLHDGPGAMPGGEPMKHLLIPIDGSERSVKAVAEVEHIFRPSARTSRC